MLSSKARLLTNSCKYIRIIFSANQSTIQKFDSAPELKPVQDEKPRREPFMKNVFLGIVDDIFFQYPNPKNIESEHVKHLKNDLINSLQGKDLSTMDKFKILIKSGILKCRLPKKYGGIEMSFSELINLYEELQLDPSLSVLLESQSSFVLQTILNHGPDEIKQKYLPKVLSGESTGAYALSELVGGSDPTAITTIAKQEDDCFKISGEKVWVTNAEHADFFIVFANNVVDNRPSMTNNLSVFLVDKCGDIDLSKLTLFGLNECGICSLKFKNVTVPKSNLIGKLGEGFRIASEGLQHHKFITLISILNNLKYFLTSSISYVHECKQFPIDLKDSELVKNKLATISSTAYALESMLYLTSGIVDNYTIDDTLESAILQLHGIEKGLDAISLCMDLLGSRAYDTSFPFEKLWRDLKGYSVSSKSIDVIKLYISLVGITHAGNKLSDIVRKNRNPLNFPGFVIKRILNQTRHAKDDPKLDLKLFMNLHPNLKPAAKQLEYCILRLQYVIDKVLSRHGSELVKRQLELKRIADVACEIYSMVAILSRASKSYCTGVRFSDQEIIMANIYCYNSYIKVKKEINDIAEEEMKLSDIYSFDLASHILNWKSYSFVHPLKPNIT
ncbi:complex I assembly factor ACAD9, mitochondrial [Halyomorpha halys]|uniref:complex I assembly factor ACAD9, mitochondrial n=1 Tax=Halyomorpha halys TaxID=286706 RepID=UPI0006D4CC3F|nr:acyl-CoA dehydrogenase family member 9, mitochondrial [Halyomorpha halys]